MPKSKFKTQTIDQILHKSIMEQMDRDEQSHFQRQLDIVEERLQRQKFDFEKRISGMVNPISYLDEVVNNSVITSTIRTIEDNKKEILIRIVLG